MKRADEKRALRQWAKDYIALLDPREKKEEDLAICKRILALPAYQGAAVIFCFAATEKEVDTRMILEQAWKDGKRVAVPRCREEKQMDAYEISSLSELQTGMYGILEPQEGCRFVYPWEIQFAVLPCMACGRNGFRLGYGGGYYDRYLQDTDFVTAAVCREQLLLEKMPAEPFDCRADWVVTARESIAVARTGRA